VYCNQSHKLTNFCVTNGINKSINGRFKIISKFLCQKNIILFYSLTKYDQIMTLARLLLRVAGVSELVLIGIHTDPDSAVEEMEALVDVHAAVERRWNTDNIVIMGDLNADCKYASGRARGRLTLRTDSRFTWLIDDDVDTTTTRTHCAYDRCYTGQPVLSRAV